MHCKRTEVILRTSSLLSIFNVTYVHILRGIFRTQREEEFHACGLF